MKFFNREKYFCERFYKGYISKKNIVEQRKR